MEVRPTEAHRRDLCCLQTETRNHHGGCFIKGWLLGRTHDRGSGWTCAIPAASSCWFKVTWMFFTSSFQSWARGGFGGETRLLWTSCYRNSSVEPAPRLHAAVSKPAQSGCGLVLTLTSEARVRRWLSSTEGWAAHSSCLSRSITAAVLEAPGSS